jgi:Holliday junction resolvasome RuvABC endonuclease subunit
MKILGLDLSLTSTGYCLIDTSLTDEPWVGRDFVTGVVWHGAVGSKTLHDVERLEMFDYWIREALHHKALPFGSATVDHVAVEGYSFGSPFNATSLGELGGVIKLAIHQAGIPLHVIPPKTWRKALCGNGNIKKHDVSKELHKRYGVEFASLDTLEAWAVAMCLRRQLLGLDKPEPKLRKRKTVPPLIPAMEAAHANDSDAGIR